MIKATNRIAITLAAVCAIAACQPAPVSQPQQSRASESSRLSEPSPKKPITVIARDCDAPQGMIESLVCTDPGLGAMDAELAAHLAFFAQSDALTTTDQAELRDSTTQFRRDRDECWKGVDPRQCTMTAYARQIHDLRVRFEATIATSESKVLPSQTRGPLRYSCDGYGGEFVVTFVDTEPGAVYLEFGYGNYTIALDRISGDGADTYAGEWDNGTFIFHSAGADATFTQPIGEAASCGLVSDTDD